jgi:ATP-dependent RNA helicase DeaD
MDIGRSDNADPRWLLPLICRRGHITRNEIGAIRIGQAETYFQIPRTIADKFAAAAARTGESETEEGALRIERSEAGPREAARSNRQRRPSRSTPDNGFVKAKPVARKFGKKPHPRPASATPSGNKPAGGQHSKKPPKRKQP